MRGGVVAWIQGFILAFVAVWLYILVICQLVNMWECIDEKQHWFLQYSSDWGCHDQQQEGMQKQAEWVSAVVIQQSLPGHPEKAEQSACDLWPQKNHMLQSRPCKAEGKVSWTLSECRKSLPTFSKLAMAADLRFERHGEKVAEWKAVGACSLLANAPNTPLWIARDLARWKWKCIPAYFQQKSSRQCVNFPIFQDYWNLDYIKSIDPSGNASQGKQIKCLSGKTLNLITEVEISTSYISYKSYAYLHLFLSD